MQEIINENAEFPIAPPADAMCRAIFSKFDAHPEDIDRVDLLDGGYEEHLALNYGTIVRRATPGEDGKEVLSIALLHKPRMTLERAFFYDRDTIGPDGTWRRVTTDRVGAGNGNFKHLGPLQRGFIIARVRSSQPIKS